LSTAGGISTVLKSAGADDLEIFHVGRVVVQIVHKARLLMHDVAGRHQGRRVAYMKRAQPFIMITI